MHLKGAVSSCRSLFYFSLDVVNVNLAIRSNISLNHKWQLKHSNKLIAMAYELTSNTLTDIDLTCSSYMLH